MDGIYCGWDLSMIVKLDPPGKGGYRWKLTLKGRREPILMHPSDAYELQAVLAARTGLEAVSATFEEFLT